MTWSQYQNDIFTFVSNGRNGSARVEAKAGSGKTTTIIQALNYLPFSAADTLFLAFNKKIADELRDRVPPGVEARTFNSVGNSAVRSGMQSDMDMYKMGEYIKKNAPEDVKKRAWGPLHQLIRAAKSAGIGVLADNDQAFYYDLIDQHDIEVPRELEVQIVQLAKRALDWNYRETKSHDFDDQLLWPLYFNLRLPQYDMVFVDEAQDLSPLQHEFLSHLVRPGGRIIAVGDKHQAIYGFRGASANSLDELQSRFSMTDLPLSISYRCPKEVVREAQKYVPDIEYAESAIEGKVNRDVPLPELEEFTPDCLVLCRINAPLLDLAMKFLRRSLPVHVLGNFGDQMVKFLKRFQANDMESFWDELAQWKQEQLADAEEREQWNRYDRIQDKYDSICMVGDGAANPSQIVQRFEKLFEPKEAPKLGTIHKGKGMEAGYVYLLYPELIPHRMATTDWQVEQEYNLIYVAITRAINEFNYVGG